LVKEESLYRNVPFSRSPAGDGLEFVYSSFNESRHVLPASHVDLLSTCTSFNSLASHAEKYLSKIRNDNNPIAPLSRFPVSLLTKIFSNSKDLLSQQKVEIIERLEYLAKCGFLVSKEHLTNLLITHGSSLEKQNRVSILGILTKDRTPSLRACLESYLENLRRHDRLSHTKILVMDDSRNQHNSESVKQLLSVMKSQYPTEYIYSGIHEKRRLLQSLKDKGDIPEEVVKFALFGIEDIACTTGANRNDLLLHSINEMLVSVDDDTLCHIARRPDIKEKYLRIDSRVDPRNVWFFHSREDAFSTVEEVDKDFLGIHEMFLGKDLSSVALPYASLEAIGFENANWKFLEGIKKQNGHVLLTFNGLLGDPAIGTQTRLLWLTGESRERFLSTSESYFSNCVSREVVRTVESPTVNNSPFCMTTFVGLDNRELLPPFMPLFRGQDGLFNGVAQKCFENPLSVYQPYILTHSPRDIRLNKPEEMWNIAGFHFSQMMQGLINSMDISYCINSPSERMTRLGDALVNIGTKESQDFFGILTALYISQIKLQIRTLENLLDKYNGQPHYWAHDVRKYISTLRESLSNPASCVPVEIKHSSDTDTASRLTQLLVRRFGELLYWWPHLIQTAKELRV
jgi:hypothetical protein